MLNEVKHPAWKFETFAGSATVAIHFGVLSRICAGQTSSCACKYSFLTEVRRCRAFSNVSSRIAWFDAYGRPCV